MNPPQPTPQMEPQTEDIPLDPAPDQEWEDIVDTVPWYAGHDLCAFALPVEPETIVEVQQLRLKMYYHISTIR